MAALGFRYLTLRSVEAVGDIVDAREHRAITAIEPGTAA
jgi:hypothetical protein